MPTALYVALVYYMGYSYNVLVKVNL